MYNKLYPTLLTACLGFAASTAALAEGGPSATMLANNCTGCHGTDGVSTGPAIPSIAGLSKQYFTDLMKAYKEGKAYSTIMTRIAKGYSEDDFKAMAEYYYAKPFVKAKQTADAKLAKDGKKLHDKYCEKCHAEGGTSRDDDSGILGGQWAPYLKWTMADFKDGHREAPKKMQNKVEELLQKEGDAGIDALIAFYASQK